MNWDEHYRLWLKAEDAYWAAVEGDEHPAGEDFWQDARNCVLQNGPDDWQWLSNALEDSKQKWFVADVFRFQPLPEQLLDAMLRAAVYERDPSDNRKFIEPCMRSHGARLVNEKLLLYFETGTNEEKAGAASAFYWSFGLNSNDIPYEDVGDVHERQYRLMLREFVNNEDVTVRQRILPFLTLQEGRYPEEQRPLVLRAIEIARAHPDEYIRHRVEIQLGAGGPYKAIPNTRLGTSPTNQPHGSGANSAPTAFVASAKRWLSSWWNRFPSKGQTG